MPVNWTSTKRSKRPRSRMVRWSCWLARKDEAFLGSNSPHGAIIWRDGVCRADSQKMEGEKKVHFLETAWKNRRRRARRGYHRGCPPLLISRSGCPDFLRHRSRNRPSDAATSG